MRKIKNYLVGIVALAGATTLISCEGEGGEPQAPPSINVTIVNPKEVYAVGEEIIIRAQFVAESRLILMSYYPVVNETAGAIVEINTSFVGIANAKNGHFDIDFDIISDYEGQTIKVEVVIQDGQGRTTKDDVEIVVTAS
jgi:hypothetical protein